MNEFDITEEKRVPKESILAQKKKGFTKSFRQDSNSSQSNVEMVGKDATEFYGAYQHSPHRRASIVKPELTTTKLLHEDLSGECYIGLQKLMNDELKTFDMKDSFMFEVQKGRSGSLIGAPPSGEQVGAQLEKK